MKRLFILLVQIFLITFIGCGSGGGTTSSAPPAPPAPPADTTSPVAITNLTTLNPTSNSMDLSWTAPGDDNNTGTATTYDIRYATSNITTNAAWDAATQVSGEPTPAVAGTSQSMTVSPLVTGTPYYFAIKTSDEVPNTSDISNVVNETTTNYVLGTTDFGQPSTSQPAQWASYVDPDTGVSIRRITDIHADYPSMNSTYGATIDYPRKTRSSSDGRYVLVYAGVASGTPYKIVDLQTHTIRDAPHISSSIYDRNNGQDAQPEYRWDYTGTYPNRIYYRYGWEFYYGEVDYPDGQANSATYNVLIHNFRNDVAEFGADAPNIQNVYVDTEGDSSADSRYWCWEVRLASGERKWVIVYDKTTDSIIGQLDVTGASINFTDMAPDGSKALVSYNNYQAQYSPFEGVRSYDLDMTNSVKSCAMSAHSGWANDPISGVPKLVQINNCGGDNVRFMNLSTGALSGLLVYGFFVEPYLVTINNVHITSDNLSKRLKRYIIVQISDLHISKIGIRGKKLLRY